MKEMKKLGLKETKIGNQLLILQLLFSGDGFSRVELAEKTHLSPSTVTTLTSDLLKRGIIEESGEKVVTAGRARTGLAISNALGYLVVVEVSHSCIYITLLSMRLEILSSKQMKGKFVDGNSVFAAVAKEIAQQDRPLAGMGILFQEDVRENSFHVMYSTGYASANISLRDAFKTQYRVPVLEESVAAFTVKDVIREVGLEERNVAHIHLGRQIQTALRIDGSTVVLKDRFIEDFSTMLPQGEGGRPLLYQLTLLLNVLFAMFPLDTVLIAGKEPLPEGFLQELQSRLNPRFTGDRQPEIVLVQEGSRERVAVSYAARIRSKSIRARLEASV